jgi:peptidoglycan-associated lipoprotein
MYVNKSIAHYLKYLSIPSLLIATTLSLASCKSNNSGIIENSRSATHYMGKGLRSLAGTHRDSKEISSPEQYVGPAEDPYLPLNPNDLYSQETNRSQEDLIGEVDELSSQPLPMETVSGGHNAITPEQFQDPERMNLSYIFQHIHFDTDDYVVRGRNNSQIIAEITQYMKEHPQMQLYIEGHCDERASAAYNLALGTRRSNSVKDLLAKNGIAIDRLFTISYGKERPIALGHTAQDWQKNRRVQFKLISLESTIARPKY